MIEDPENPSEFNLDSIIENSCLPRFYWSHTYDWNMTRLFSIVDLDSHPMKEKAKVIIQKHLSRMQQMASPQS
jgi:hypothetical protein